MKRFVILSFLFLVCVAAYSQYRCVVQSSTKNSVTLRCVGYGSNAKKASKEAELNAIKTLLFVGADNTPYKYPLIGNDKTSAEENNKAFFNDFYSESFRNFIDSSIIPHFEHFVYIFCDILQIIFRQKSQPVHLPHSFPANRRDL